jgi:tricarboxylate carrier
MTTNYRGDYILGYPKYPPFALGKPRFSQDSFLGRWLHFADMIDPRTLLTSKAQLSKALNLLKEYEAGACSETTDKQLWEAQKIKQAMIHPDTGEKILMPFRMSGYVPFGTPMVVGLLLPNPSLASSVCWQWINQSHNACVNYANRNATKETPMYKFVQGYIGAVTTAVGIAVGLNVLLKRAEKMSPATKAFVKRFIPLPAVCMASTCNCLLMRIHEAWEGIEVYDGKGKVVGTSKIAATRAVRDTSITRAFLPAPIFLIPPLVMSYLEKKRFLQRRMFLHLPINVLVCTLSFAFSLPTAIALFPQESKIQRRDLEEELQAKTTEEVLMYNKGL